MIEYNTYWKNYCLLPWYEKILGFFPILLVLIISTPIVLIIYMFIITHDVLEFDDDFDGGYGL